MEEIELLASKFHDIYMKEAKRQDDVRHVDLYSDLRESTKEYDRVLARFIIHHVDTNTLHKMIDDLV